MWGHLKCTCEALNRTVPNWITLNWNMWSHTKVCSTKSSEICVLLRYLCQDYGLSNPPLEHSGCQANISRHADQFPLLSSLYPYRALDNISCTYVCHSLEWTGLRHFNNKFSLDLLGQNSLLVWSWWPQWASCLVMVICSYIFIVWCTGSCCRVIFYTASVVWTSDFVYYILYMLLCLF
jgi:hypothetical protein